MPSVNEALGKKRMGRIVIQLSGPRYPTDCSCSWSPALVHSKKYCPAKQLNNVILQNITIIHMTLRKRDYLLVFVAGVVPIIPATVGHHVIKVSIGEDNPGVLAHGPANVQWACTCHPAA